MRTVLASQVSCAEYGSNVASLASLSHSDHLIPGSHYDSLASFLHPSRRGNGNGPYVRRQSSAAAAVATAHDPSDDFCFVTVVDIADKVEVRDLLNPVEYTEGPQIGKDRAQIVFLRGYPSAAWLNTLGTALKVDPEFWRSHMLLLRRDDHYDWPRLPSFSHGILQLRVSTIVKPSSAITRKEVESGRQSDFDHLRKQQAQAQDVGASMVRNLHAYSEWVCSIDQNISCTVVHRSEGWAGLPFWQQLTYIAAIVWLDVGRPLPVLPFPTPVTDFTCTPIIATRRKVSLQSPDGGGMPSTAQNTMLLAAQYGFKGLRDHPDLMRKSPLYALSDVFRHCACSLSQVIDMLQAHVSESLLKVKSQEELSLADLSAFKQELDGQAQHVRTVLDFLGHRACAAAWMTKPSPQPALTSPLPQQAGPSRNGSSSKTADDRTTATDVAEATLKELTSDYSGLLQRLQDLSAQCKDGVDTILNAAQLRESRNAISQAAEVQWLTLLISVFAPLSLITPSTV
ncbi:hypothetical protein HMPREF1624_08049 [Sporothrix schenckii ATCC 58251]|uniref:Uncharacterized protein n=1 Tax=Sporothrix schenckii (strain ATCC 58251 / de Perez 2211183) TaxID=1391915 RepID=U7PIT1_SPOS1|nr:hypothetical protein HMPREF1624_08049 [Sporothrix schenckii ATCC 58251]